MRKYKRLLFCIPVGLLLVACSKTPAPSSNDVTPKQEEVSVEPTDEGKEDAPTTDTVENQDVNEEVTPVEQEPVKATVTVYEGFYFDEKTYGFEGEEVDESVTTCTITISNVTETSFDFVIDEVVYVTDEVANVIPLSTAYFVGDGATAECQTDTGRIVFSFPSKEDVFPKTITVQGMEQMEGNTYINNSIPGHESG